MKIMTGKISCLLSILFFTALVAALAMVLYGFWAPLAATIQDTPVQLPVQPGPILEAILLFALLLILAVGLLLFALFAKRGQFIESRARFIHLAFFMLLAGIWLFFESQVPFLISSTRIAFRFSAYFSFYLMAVPFLLFIRDMCEHGENILNGLIVLFLLNFAFHFGYLWRHDFLFPESLIFVHSLMAISLLILILISGMEVFHYQNSEARGLLLALVFLGLFSAAGLLQYYLDPMADGVMMWTIGVVVFVLVLALDTMGRVFANYSKIKQFQTIADSIPNGLFRAKNDRHLTLIYANDAFFSTYGYRSAQEAEKAGFLWVDFAIDSQQQDKLWQLRQQYLAQGTYCFEIEARTHDVQGKVIWVLNRLEYQPDSDEICGAMMEITDRKNMETLLRIRAEQYRIAVAQSGKRIFRYDIKTKTLYHQHANAEMLSAESAVKNIPDIAVTRGIIAPESVDAYLHFYQMIQQGDKTGHAVVRMRDEEKSQYLWYHCDFTTIFDDGEQPQQSIISFYDITEQREKELAYERMRQDILSVPPEQIAVYDCNLTRGTIENTEGKLLQGIDDAKNLFFEQQMVRHLPYVHPQERQQLAALMNRTYLLDNFVGGVYSHSLEYRLMLTDMGYQWVRITVQLVQYPDSDEIKAFVLVRDINGEKQEELALRQRSQTDALTSALNRGAFAEQVDLWLQGDGIAAQHAFVMLDLDHFKQINDTFGHIVGDQVLIAIVANLKTLLRAGDMIGRIGGDEFMLCLKNIPFDEVMEKRAQLICQMIASLPHMQVRTSASIGIAMYPRDGHKFSELYQKADIAMYQAKERGRNGYVLYRPDGWGEEKHRERTPIDNLPVPGLGEGTPIYAEIFRQEHLLEQEQENAEHYRLLVKGLGLIVFEWQVETGIFYRGAGFADYVLGRQEPDLLFRNQGDMEAIHAEDIVKLRGNLFAPLQAGREYAATTVRLKRVDGSYQLCRLGAILVRNGDGALQRGMGVIIPL